MGVGALEELKTQPPTVIASVAVVVMIVPINAYLAADQPLLDG
jgi:hypothetical protein